MSANAEREFVALRTQVHSIVLTKGCAIAPGSVSPEAFDDLIDAVAKRSEPGLVRESDALLSRISDHDLARQISDHFGHIMATYGDGGYFVGVCAGLELAALTFCGVALPTKKGRTR